MPHVDPETLALLALGEDPDEVSSVDDDRHLATCSSCQGETDSLSRIATLARGQESPTELAAPNPAIWQRISTELGLAEEPSAGADPVPLLGAPTVRGRRRWPVVVAAAAAVLLGVSVGVWWQIAGDAGSTTVAMAVLAPLPDWPDAHGTATVEQTDDQERQIAVTLDAGTPAVGYREVWLIAEDDSGLISIGLLDGRSGRFDIPDGVDLSRYSLVDISQESFDGDPTHSGDSIVRGALR